MRVPLAPLALLAALAGLACAAPSAGAAPILQTDLPITDIAASGRDVAVLAGCRRVTVVRADGTLRRRLPPANTLCGGTPRYRPGPLAFDGRRIAFRNEGGGNNLEGTIFTARAARGVRPRPIDSATEVEGDQGDHFDGPRGGAGLIAYLDIADVTTSVRLVAGGTRRTIETIDAPARLLAVRGTRIVLRTGGQIRVLNPVGATVATTSASGVLAAAILGERVLLLYPKRIVRINPDGKFGAAVKLAGRARATSSFGSVEAIAVYSDRHRVRAVRLSDGRDRIVALVPSGPVKGSGLVRAAIGSTGIVYARNRGCSARGACHGQVYRVSNETIRKAFRRTNRPPDMIG